MLSLLLDTAMILVPLGTTVTANTTYSPVPAAVWQAPVCGWMLNISAVNSGPIYTFVLEWSATSGGTFAPLASFDVPTALNNPKNFCMGLSGNMARSTTAKWIRLRVVIGGGGRSVTFGSWLGPFWTMPGFAARAHDVLELVT